MAIERRNWRDNAVTYGQTAAKKRVTAQGGMTKAEVRRAGGDHARNDVWTRVHSVASTMRFFSRFYWAKRVRGSVELRA